MRGRHQALHMAQSKIPAIITVRLHICLSAVNAHAYSNRRRSPGFHLQLSLCLQRGLQRLARIVEGSGKRVTNNLKDKSIVSLNALSQNFVMARKQGGHVLRMLLRKLGAAFDIGKKKCHRTSGNVIHRTLRIKRIPAKEIVCCHQNLKWMNIRPKFLSSFSTRLYNFLICPWFRNRSTFFFSCPLPLPGMISTSSIFLSIASCTIRLSSASISSPRL